MGVVVTQIIGTHQWESREPGVSFDRRFNEAWGADQVSVTLHYPERPADATGPAHSSCHICGFQSSSHNQQVRWFEGFEVVAPRPDLIEKKQTIRVVYEEELLLDDACRRLENRSLTAIDQQIYHCERHIKRLQAELEMLRETQKNNGQHHS